MRIKIDDSNYEIYKKVFGIFSNNMFGELLTKFSPETNPINVLDNWEQKSIKMAKKGLQTGLNDYLSSYKNYPKEIIEKIEKDLIENNLPTLNQLTSIN